ncbi:MAG: hypothetical protein HYY26_04790 [Acidobacteria bacterium]|nr:hypothetical protein [Acidobacteriota bacterium]
MGQRQCPSCGKYVADSLTQCPHCREYLPHVEVARGYDVATGRVEIRRGLLYMLLAGVFYYFAAGYSPLTLPFPYSRWLADVLLPLLFLAGLGLALFGLVRRMRG